MSDALYLDNNATTPLAAEAVEAMARAAQECWGNPSSQHAFGRRARQVLEDAREAIGSLLGADLNGFPPDRVIFTSGGTEANNLTMFGLTASHASPGQVIISEIEHPSVAGPADMLASQGWQVDKLPAAPSGEVLVDELHRLLRPDTRLISVMLANNETGVLQPVERIAQIAAEAGVPVHTDAVQPVGKLPVNFRQLGVATMTATAHKFHGPIGIGVLVVRAGIDLRPMLFGGHQQEGFRPGTEPVVLAAGMRAALEGSHREGDQRRRRMQSLRDEFEGLLLAEFPGLVIHGRDADRLPHTSHVAFPGVDGQALGMALDLAGIACSTGSACASGSSKPSPILLAMGVAEGLARSSLRFSFGASSTAAEMREAARRIIATYNDLRHRRPAEKFAATRRVTAANPL
ncbi:MAG TPA: cysteine desulfurase family protein [Pirellulales bacterium]|nr:cysteine desulfurase family protein [Pirellulales bacterium]